MFQKIFKTLNFKSFYRVIYVLPAFLFSISTHIDFLVAFVLSLLLYVFIFYDADKKDSLIVSFSSAIFFLSIYLLKNSDIEQFSVLSLWQIFFVFPYYVFPSVLIFLTDKYFRICTLLPTLTLFIFPEINEEFLVLSGTWILGTFLCYGFLRRARRRFALFKVAAIWGLFGGVLILLLLGKTFESIAFLISSVFSAFLSVSILYFFERVFNVLTPFYLFDLQDIENPLLVNLRKRAPGTFHHSLVVADIAYVAAKEVGANAELVRCAALYHDIGKMVRPYYFIENIGRMDYHLKIGVPLSSKLVIKHVEDGVKLAKAHSLPQRIIDFILEHHGTTYPEYFVKAAKKLDIEIDSRYPGPTPRSVETVIMMICDSAEAAVRALEEYKVEEIYEAVRKVVRSKFEQGQFDNAPVTIQLLKKIEEAVAKALVDFYHLRISYEEASIEKYVKMKKQAENRQGEAKHSEEPKVNGGEIEKDKK